MMKVALGIFTNLCEYKQKSKNKHLSPYYFHVCCTNKGFQYSIGHICFKANYSVMPVYLLFSCLQLLFVNT